MRSLGPGWCLLGAAVALTPLVSVRIDRAAQDFLGGSCPHKIPHSREGKIDRSGETH